MLELEFFWCSNKFGALRRGSLFYNFVARSLLLFLGACRILQVVVRFRGELIAMGSATLDDLARRGGAWPADNHVAPTSFVRSALLHWKKGSQDSYSICRSQILFLCPGHIETDKEGITRNREIKSLRLTALITKVRKRALNLMVVSEAEIQLIDVSWWNKNFCTNCLSCFNWLRYHSDKDNWYRFRCPF